MKNLLTLGVALSLLGCQGKPPQVGGAANLVWHECTLPSSPSVSFIRGAYLSESRNTVLFGFNDRLQGWGASSSDGGKNWSPPTPLAAPTTTYLGTYADEVHLVGAPSQALLLYRDSQGDQGFLEAFSWSGQETEWQNQGRQPWSDGIREVGHWGPSLWVAGRFQGPNGQTRCLTSADEGKSWKVLDWTPPVPGEKAGTTLANTSEAHGPTVCLDQQQKAHFLIEECVLRDSKSSVGGLLTSSSREGEKFESQFFPGKYSFRSRLGINLTEPDTLYLATAEQQSAPGVSNYTDIPFHLSLWTSRDGGKTWGPPLLLDDHKGTKERFRVGGSGKNIVVAWKDGRSDKRGLYFCSSRDGGRSWSAPQLVAEQVLDFQMVLAPDHALLVGWPVQVWRCEF
jgi:hypothetical protein